MNLIYEINICPNFYFYLISWAKKVKSDVGLGDHSSVKAPTSLLTILRLCLCLCISL